MKTVVISLACLAVAPFAVADTLPTATQEEILQASLAAVENGAGKYEPVMTEVRDTGSGDMLERYTFSGPIDDLDAILGACNIRHHEETGLRQNDTIVRQSALIEDSCGGATADPRFLGDGDTLTVSFHIREISLQ